MDTDLKFVMFEDEEEDESMEAEGDETRKSMGTDDGLLVQGVQQFLEHFLLFL